MQSTTTALSTPISSSTAPAALEQLVEVSTWYQYFNRVIHGIMECK